MLCNANGGEWGQEFSKEGSEGVGSPSFENYQYLGHLAIDIEDKAIIMHIMNLERSKGGRKGLSNLSFHRKIFTLKIFLKNSFSF